MKLIQKILCFIGLHKDCQHSRIKTDRIGEIHCKDCGQSAEYRYKGCGCVEIHTRKRFCTACNKSR